MTKETHSDSIMKAKMWRRKARKEKRIVEEEKWGAGEGNAGNRSEEKAGGGKEMVVMFVLLQGQFSCVFLLPSFI